MSETNFEHYKEEIIADIYASNGCAFIKEKVLKKDNCDGVLCADCKVKIKEWLEQPYGKPAVDWSKVEIDTPVIVTQGNGVKLKRHFCKFENEYVYVFGSGTTSWSDSGKLPWKPEEVTLAGDVN